MHQPGHCKTHLKLIATLQGIDVFDTHGKFQRQLMKRKVDAILVWRVADAVLEAV